MQTILFLLQTLIASAIFLVVAAPVGCLIAGVDRKLSARMQGRVGPKVLQPYWDVRKLFEKEWASVEVMEVVYVVCALVFSVIAGGIFFSGGNILLSIFILTLSSLFFIMAGYATRSPFAEAGAARETIQVMAYEPMVLIMAAVFYLNFGSFDSAAVAFAKHPLICYGWPAFLGLLFVLTIKLRKSPFDLSTSHHAHQELVKGITTEMCGPTLGLVEIMHWCENVLFLGWVGMFFVFGSPVSALVALAVVAVTYFLEIWIDNNFARVKWQFMLAGAWGVTFVFGVVNLVMLAL